MIEATLFLLIAGIVSVSFLYIFNITWVSPHYIALFLSLMILPGLYAAFTSGPFVPSARKRHKKMLGLADLQKKDIVYDLGCGDGRLIFSVAPNVKRAVGYDLSIPLVLFGKLKAVFTLSKAKIRFGNLWKQDYKDADVVFCYLLPRAMKQFYKEVWPTLKKGTRVVSNAFEISEVKPVKKEDKVYLYVK